MVTMVDIQCVIAFMVVEFDHGYIMLLNMDFFLKIEVLINIK
jgi:hypothetical protein